ncbi:hypothetical protein [Kroppenstedtia sanguinis]|uniref:Lipoprotein n=1 Tax=Kroppenstedtia sanguinis TaxID=1380684 RepID=A0ABW4C8C3_9BACL
MKKGLCSLFLVMLAMTACMSLDQTQTLPNDNTAKNVGFVIQEEMKVENNHHPLLEKGKEIADSENSFQTAVGFIPDKEFSKRVKVMDDKVRIIENKNGKKMITGRLIIDNGTQKELRYQSLFLQGNDVKEHKTMGGKWKKALVIQVKPKSSSIIPIQIKWNPNGANELTVFPLDQSNHVLYDGSHLGLNRFFVQNGKVSIHRSLIEKQSFNMPQNINDDSISLLPILIPKGNKKAIQSQVKSKEKGCIANEKLKSIDISPVPYNTQVDVLWVDEYGNSKIIKEGVDIRENKKTSIFLPNHLIKKIYEMKQRQFILVFSNRANEMLADIKALNQQKKPYSTNYQGIVEICKRAQ